MAKKAKLPKWIDPDDVARHLQLPGGAPTEMSAYCDAAEAYIEAHLHTPTDPAGTADFYQVAIMVTADLWADRQTTGGLQSGGPDIGFIRLGDFSQHVQLLMDPYRRWSEMMA